jgi:phosphoribosylaminoimidazole-succinocarboxamide synthase
MSIDTLLKEVFVRSGKVRDIYDVSQQVLLPNQKLLLPSKSEESFLMIATNRISAFDVVLPTEIQDKGKVLTLLSAFWFAKTRSMVPNHLIEVADSESLKRIFGSQTSSAEKDNLVDRSMVVVKAHGIPIEGVVRGYLYGSAWDEYVSEGTVGRVPIPKGLREAQRLPEPLFTPTTKATSGHDLPLDQTQLEQQIGKTMAREIFEKSMAIYLFAHWYALSRGIIIADTKIEFGLADDRLILIDELLTPDSSRFWDANKYEVGKSQHSLDKQPVRDWLVSIRWNKEPPAPDLPPEVAEATSKRYVEAYQRLTGATKLTKRALQLALGKGVDYSHRRRERLVEIDHQMSLLPETPARPDA